jgi:hypothetical protein
MRRAAIFIIATLSGVTAFSQSLLDCIEPDVLRVLLLQGQGDRMPVISAAVPAEISTLRMPREFTWIGSAERALGRMDATTNLTQVTAAYRSSLAPDAARAATASALTASGWEVRPPLGLGSGVFSSADMVISQQACRDGKSVSFNANAMDGITYVLVTIQRGNSANTICTQPSAFAMISNNAFAPYLPRLKLPSDPATGAAARSQGSGSSSSGGVLTARVEFSVKDSIGNVGRNFARQMTEQGWTSDANWAGASTAGSSWSRREAGALIQATLQVTAVDDRQFAATLRIQKLQ